jgi:hypothetical protein
MTIATAAPADDRNPSSELASSILESRSRRRRRPTIAAIKRAAAARLEASRLAKAFELDIVFVIGQ